MRDHKILLQDLWEARLSTALACVEKIYAPDGFEDNYRSGVREEIQKTFWRTLLDTFPTMPETEETRFEAVVCVVQSTLQNIRETTTMPFIEERLAVALSPASCLPSETLTEEVCEVLYDFHRGIWTPHLTKPQLWIIRMALAEVFAAFQPSQMTPFWNRLESENPMQKQAMLLGLEFLCQKHAVPALLHGLETDTNHLTRTAIVDCLEQISDPTAIPLLSRLRRETAQSDWTLSRQIARTIRAIEQQNRGQQHRVLLRATDAPPIDDRGLVRPASPPNTDTAELLRPDEEKQD